MMPNSFSALPRAAQRSLLSAAMLALTATVAGCGGGDSGGYTPLAVSQTAERRELPQALMTRASINYSPYRTAANADGLSREVITAANVLQDLRLVQAAGFGTIRLFTSSIFSETVLQVIRDYNLDLKVYLGAYPVNPVTPAIEAANQVDLDAAIRLAKAYPDTVLAVSIGNEAMVEWSGHRTPPEVIGGYLRKVRAAITQPITTNDNWLFWASVPKVIAENIDFAAVHVYPFLDTHYNATKYDWRQRQVPEAQRAQAMIDATLAEAKLQFNDARKGLQNFNLGNMPMLIGETGWAAVDTPGGPNLAFRAHPVNQKLYFDALQTWVAEGRRDTQGPKAIFYFQAFDEPWKQGDDGWGLFNAQRQARYTVQSLGTCDVTWTCETGSYTTANAVKWTAPTLNAPVTASRYTLLANTAVAGEQMATGLRWDPFVATGYADSSDGAASSDGGSHLLVTPNPADFGWGLFLYSGTGVTANLSNFASGRLNFSVRSDGYPGKIEVGISTDNDDREGQEAFIQIAPGELGYCNTNTWCNVSVPIASFLAANPKLDLRYVNFRFTIADRYSFTGKPLNLTGLPPLRIDNIHWTR
jgi:exo-beta-1,3-glucanase (GH17 family)